MQKYTVIIGASGVGGGKVPTDKLWSIGTDYIAYKADGGAFIEEEGRLSTKGDDAELKRLRMLLLTNSVAVITGTKKGNSIVLHEVLESKVTTDAAANAIIEEALKPVIFMDEILGKFILDKSINIFGGTIDVDEHSVAISIDTIDKKIDEKDIALARALCADIKKLIHDASAFAASTLIELANDWGNDSWEDEGDGPFPGISKEEFISRIELETISISNGSYTLWFDDGDLFWGHVICVDGDLENGFTDASMQG